MGGWVDEWMGRRQGSRGEFAILVSRLSLDKVRMRLCRLWSSGGKASDEHSNAEHWNEKIPF